MFTAELLCYNLIADDDGDDGDDGDAGPGFSEEDDSPIEILDDDDSVDPEERLPDLPSGEYSLAIYT